MGFDGIDPLVSSNMAMENSRSEWRFLAGKIIHCYGGFSSAMFDD